jgi:hypothetical protein
MVNLIFENNTMKTFTPHLLKARLAFYSLFLFFLFLLVFSLFTKQVQAQAIPASGDVVFTEFQTDIDDIEFLTLKRLDLRGLKVTDNGVLSTGLLRTGEGTYTFPSTAEWADIPAGTFIRLTQKTGTDDIDPSDGIITIYGDGTNVAKASSFRLSTSGDQVIIYTGTATNPSYIAGIIGAGANWSSGATSNSTSKAPGTLSDFYTGTTNDDARMNAAVSASTFDAIRTACLTASKWESSNNQLTEFGLKNILFNESNYLSGSITFSNVNATDFTINASSLVFSDANADTRYMIVVRATSTPSYPVDRYTCYSNVTTNFSTAPTVVTAVATAPCTSPTLGSGSIVYFGYGLPSALTISGLTVNTNYQVRVFAVNGNGFTANMSAIPASASQTTYSKSSDITANAGYTYSTNIPYQLYQNASSLTTASSIGAMGLILRDGAGTADADLAATVLTDITFSTGSSTLIRTAALFDGNTNIAEVAVNGATSFTFSGLSITANDNSIKNFELRVTYQRVVTDNQQIKFTVTNVKSGDGSGFAAQNAGGAVSSTTGNNNRIAVIASQLVFDQQPSNSLSGVVMSPAVRVKAVDALGNLDVDYTATVSLTTTGTFSNNATTSVASVGGVATFNNIVYIIAATNITITASSGSLSGTGPSNPFDITINCVAPTLSASITNILCAGNNTGAIQLTVTGGTSPYTYRWTGPSFTSSSKDISSLAAGTYNITVTANGGCTASASYTVIQPPSLSLSVAAGTTSLLCRGDSTTLIATASGGNGTFQYSINNGNYQSNNVFTVPAGTYTIKVKDNNGCIKTASPITITQPATSISMSYYGDIPCYGSADTLAITASGGTGTLLYSLNGGAYQPGNNFIVTAGTYLIAVKDANGCIVTDTAQISQPDSLGFNYSTGTIACNGGTTTLTVTAFGGTGIIKYKLDGGAYVTGNTFTSVSGGNHTVSVMDENGCVHTKIINVAQPASVTIVSATKTSYKGNDMSCFAANDGIITVTATGGTGVLQYSKNNGASYQSSNVFSGLSAGTYQIKVKDINNCTSAVTTVVITNPPQLIASESHTNILCNGGSSIVTISATGGTTPYSGTGVFTQNAGSHTYIVTDANGCSSTVVVNLTQPPALAISASASNVSCSNETTTLTAVANGGTPPYQYSIDGTTYQNGNTFTVPVGTYTVTVKDAANCVKNSNQVAIAATDAIAPVITCNGNITVNNDAGKCYATVDLTGHATATDNCAVRAITYQPAGPYNVGTTAVTASATDGSGNSSTCTFTVTVNDTEKPSITCPAAVKVSNDPGKCYATGVDLGTPATSDNCGIASVTNNAPSQFPIGNTVVTWTVTDVHGNTSTCKQTVMVSDVELPVITCPSNTTVDVNENCSYTVGDFTSSIMVSDNCPAVTVTQSPLAGTVLPLGDHTITLTATDNAGNTSTCSFTLTVADQTAPSMINPGDQTGLADSTNCNYVVPDLTGLVTATDNCSSSVTLTQSIPVGSVYNAGTYPVTITAMDEAGNSSTITFNLTILPASPPNTGPMSGPQDVCPYIGTGVPVTYSVEDTKFATSYTWSATSGITIVSGQGTRMVQVLFDSSYIRGSITVYASSPCGAGPIRNYTVGRQIPNTLGAIYGPVGVCSYIGSTTNYWVNKVRYATGYNWQVPAGASIVAHPGGSGENDTVITVAFSSSFTSGNIIVNTLSNCYTGLPKKLPVTLQAPLTPGQITGPTNACPLMGTNQTAIYMIRAVKNATSYLWTVPTGATIVSGQGDTAIAVSYDHSFTSGVISVIAVSNCGNSTARTLSIKRNLPATPGTISGLKDVCPLVGTDQTTVYSIKPAKDANSYLWTVPAGATIVSGQGDTAIVVSFGPNLVAGNISVVSVNNCAQSAARTLAITRKIPATPSVIYGSTDACATIGTATNVKYSIKKVAGASSYEWTVPDGATLVSGQGDTAIFVNYTTAFTSGAISVASVSNCGTSAVRSLTIKKNAPVVPGVITETPPVCPSRTATYSIAPCANATAYDWIVPAGSTIVGNANGTTITVVYPNDSVSGSVSVRSRNNCSASALKTLKVAYSACAAARVVTTAVSGSGITVNNDPNAQVDSVKSNLVNDGFVLINQTSVYMDNQKELPVFKYLDEGNEYRYVFIADKSVTMSDISFRNPDDKEIYNFRRYTGSDGNTSVFNYTPHYSGNYVVRVKQFGSGDKPRLEGHILIFKRKR